MQRDGYTTFYGEILPDRPVKVRPAARGKKRKAKHAPSSSGTGMALLSCLLLLAGSAFLIQQVTARYAFSLRAPVHLSFQSPLLIVNKVDSDVVRRAIADQNGRPLTANQRYACEKFGDDCRIALAIQRAENAPGKCDVYNYNNNGTLDWGYFQINTVHLKRDDVVLRDLLDCKANIDFAYKLYVERKGFTPWSTFNSGAYRQHLRDR